MWLNFEWKNGVKLVEEYLKISLDRLGLVKEAETYFLKLKIGDDVWFYRSSSDELSDKKTKGRVVSMRKQFDFYTKENVVVVKIFFLDEVHNEAIYKKRFLRAKNGKSISFLESSPVNKLAVELL